MMQLFKDRQSAGKLLAKHLKHYKGVDDVLVLGIPRGGVVVATELARILKLPFDIIITRKIGASTQPELALGAVDPDGEVVWDEELLRQLELRIKNLEFRIKEEKEEIERRENEYRQDRKPLDVSGKTVILVDDGIATGSTILSAINYLRRHGAEKIILAVPVASKEAIDKIKPQVDELVVLEIPSYFQAVGQFYHQFEPVSDEEVVQLLSSRT